MMIPLMKNAFLHEEETRQALIGFLSKDQRLSMASQCEKFEEAFSAFQGRSHSALFNSGGSANLALIQALLNLGRLKKGDRVGVSALTWSTNVMPIIQLGLEPVPIDVETDTMNVSSALLRASNEKYPIKAFFITNVLGFVDDIDEIQAYCSANNIILIEDNCESLGTQTKAGMAGNFGLAATFSFFVAHHMSTIEGGMVATDDEDLADMLKIVRANGWDRNLSPQRQDAIRKQHGVTSDFDGKYSFYDLGYNLRPTEITGFLGLYQLRYLPDNIDARERNYLRFYEACQKNPDLQVLKHTHISKISTFALPVIAKDRFTRDYYEKLFTEAGIETRPLIAGNITKQPFFRKYVTKEYKLPNTDCLHDHGFYCGNYPELTENDMLTIEQKVSSR